MKIALLVLTLLLLAGCVAQPSCDVPPTDATPIVLGSDLPPEVLGAFEQAAAEWNRAAPVRVQIVYGSPEASSVVMVDNLDQGRQAECLWCEQLILMRRDIPTGELFAITAHEIGHWLGWNGEGESGIMSQRRPWGMRCIDEAAAAPFGGKGTCDDFVVRN